MVQCPVGNRCPKCAGKFTSHVLEVTPVVIAKTLAASIVVGCVFGFLNTSMMGFYGYFILYAVGILVGNAIHRVSGYKMGPKISATVLVGVLVGTVLSPMYMRMSGSSSSSVRAAYTAAMPAGAGMTAVEDTSLRGELIMLAAKQKAQKSWDAFEDAYQSKIGDAYRVRVPASQGKVRENVWLEVTSIDGDDVTGTIVSNPLKLKTLKAKDSLTVPKKDVGDWFYERGQQSLGGFTFQNQAAAAAAASAAEYANYGYDGMSGAGSGFGCIINLITFLLGIFTPIFGIVPPIRLPFMR